MAISNFWVSYSGTGRADKEFGPSTAAEAGMTLKISQRIDGESVEVLMIRCFSDGKESTLQVYDQINKRCVHDNIAKR